MLTHRSPFCIGLLIFLFSSFAYGEPTESQSNKPHEEPPKIGNFALPFSQQIGPFMSFGQNMIDKNQTQLFLFNSNFVGADQSFNDIIPALLHQATDNLSLLLSQPIIINSRQNQDRSSGLSDVLLQLEYSIHSKETTKFSEQATIVGYMTLPSGSTQKEPVTGLGAPSFFLGGTFNRTYVNWYVFTSDGVVETTSQNGLKFGNQFIYQFGLGRVLCAVPSKYIFAALFEINGTYTEKTKINGFTDPNSGGNIIYLIPSLWLSGKKLILQLGFGVPITQHLFGEQKEVHYFTAASLTWTF